MECSRLQIVPSSPFRTRSQIGTNCNITRQEIHESPGLHTRQMSDLGLPLYPPGPLSNDWTIQGLAHVLPEIYGKDPCFCPSGSIMLDNSRKHIRSVSSYCATLSTVVGLALLEAKKEACFNYLMTRATTDFFHPEGPFRAISKKPSWFLDSLFRTCHLSEGLLRE